MHKLPNITVRYFFFQYLKKDVSDKVEFLHVDNHQSFLQVDLNALGIKFSTRRYCHN